MAQDEYLTAEKYKEFKEELDFLRHTRRKEVAESLEYAKSLGDLSENAEYHEARAMQGAIEERIAKLEEIMKSAVIVSMHHSEVVGVGSTVVVRKEKEKEQRVYHIVGSEEVDMAAGKISHHSPLGQAMMGKKKGDAFAFTTPGGEVHYTIITIE